MYVTGADLENEKRGFFCMRTLRAGENFAQPHPFILKGHSQSARFTCLTEDKVCCLLCVLHWTSALPGRSKNCKLEKGVPGGFLRTQRTPAPVLNVDPICFEINEVNAH